MDNNVEKQSEEKHYVEEVSQSVQDLIYSGQKIAAIKELRSEKGLGLKEAKEEAERIEVKLRELSPGHFAAKSGSGCMGVVLVIMVVAVGAWALVQ